MLTLIFIFIFATFKIEEAESKSQKPLMGPYKMNVKFLEKCPSDEKYTIDYNLKVTKLPKGKISASLNFTLPYPMEPALGVEVSIAIKRNGVWKPNFFNQRIPDACRAFEYGNPTVYKQLAKQSRVPAKCPFPKGQMQLIDYKVEMSHVFNPLKSFYYGSFQVDMAFVKEKHTVACIRVYIDTTPKNKT